MASMMTSIILFAPDDARICSRQFTALPAGAVFGMRQACNDVLPRSNRRSATRCVGFRVERRCVFIKIPYKPNCACPDAVRRCRQIAVRISPSFRCDRLTRSRHAALCSQSAEPMRHASAVTEYRLGRAPRQGLMAGPTRRAISLMKILSPAHALRLVSIWRSDHLAGCGRP
jgi:hypothetical protein